MGSRPAGVASDQLLVERVRRRGGAGRDAELAEDVADVPVHRALAQHQLLGDGLLVAPVATSRSTSSSRGLNQPSPVPSSRARSGSGAEVRRRSPGPRRARGRPTPGRPSARHARRAGPGCAPPRTAPACGPRCPAPRAAAAVLPPGRLRERGRPSAWRAGRAATRPGCGSRAASSRSSASGGGGLLGLPDREQDLGRRGENLDPPAGLVGLRERAADHGGRRLHAARGPGGAGRVLAAGPRRGATRARSAPPPSRTLPSSRSRLPRTWPPSRRPRRRASAVPTAVELVERLRPTAVELLELGPAYLALAGEVAELRLRRDPARHRGGPLLGAIELVDRPAALDHAAVDDALDHRRALTGRDAEHRLVEAGEPSVGAAGGQQEQALLVQRQCGVLLGTVPARGPDALTRDPGRLLQVATGSGLERARPP